MPNNKDQHYVPKMLMKRFADSNHLFSFVVRTEDKTRTITNNPYDNQCQYDYYYGRDKEWEHELGTIERKCSPIFDKIENDYNYYPSEEEINVIKQFVMSQHARTPRMIQWEKRNIKRAFVEQYRLYKRNTEGNAHLSQAELKWIDDNKSDSFENQAKDIMRRISFETVKYISDLELIIVHFDCKKNLILSDDPVVVINPFIHSAGFISIGLIMIIPISCKTLLVFRDPVLYENVDKIVYSSRDNAVNAINRYQAITFDKRLMFYDNDGAEYVNGIIEATKADRARFNKTGEGGVFPGINDVMIIQHHPTLSTNYPFVFSNVKKEYRKFKYFDNMNYRFHSDRYLDRLYHGLPIFAQQPMSNIDLKKLPSYIDFTKQYWNLHKSFETVEIDIDADKENENADDDS